jgi:acyl carrier protein
MGLEQEFELTISDAVAEEFQTIADIEAYVRNVLQPSGS